MSTNRISNFRSYFNWATTTNSHQFLLNNSNRFSRQVFCISDFVIMDAAIEQYAPSEMHGDTPNVSLTLPFALHPSCLHMQVRSGSKTKSLLPFAMRKLFPTENGAATPGIEQVTWNAFGDGISKAIACAELTKRRSTIPLHQYVQIGYKRIEQIWQPVRENNELDTLKVNKDIPAICILLSKISLPTMNEGDN